MLFWNLLSRHATQVALNDVRFGDVSFAELDREADEWAARLAVHARRIGSSTGKLLLGIEIEARSPIITAYLGALKGGHPVILAEPGGLSKDSAIARRYRPRSFDDLIGQEAMVRTISTSPSSAEGPT